MRVEFFRRGFLVAALGLLTGAMANASVIACRDAGSTFADLLATNSQGGCMIEDKLFSDFTYETSSTGGATEVLETDFHYQTIENAPTAVGFDFTFPLNVLEGQSNDIKIGWLVTGPNITSNHLTMTGGGSGPFAAAVFETFCKGGPLATCPNGASDTLSVSSATQSTDEAFFDPVSALGVSKDIIVVAGQGGFAHISGVTQVVDQLATPEPTTLALAGFSLLGLGVWGRRKRSRA